MFNFLKISNNSHVSKAVNYESRVAELEDRLNVYKKAFDDLSAVANKVAKGDFTARVIFWDEYGDLSETLANINQSYDLADAYVRESSASLQAARRKEYYREFLTQGILGDLGRGAEIINATSAAMAKADTDRLDAITKISNEFQNEVMQVVTSLLEISEQSSMSAKSLLNDARDNQSRAANVAAAAEQATVNVQTVASASEELSASVEEIASQVSSSSVKTRSAAESSIQTKNTIEVLNEASGNIGRVVNLISDIAEQTNLLALNATIEAARAGDAGKGFAVVASEVKSLAGQTANATSEIDKQVEDIQNKTKQSVISVNEITKIIESLNEIATAIASATEEQSAATMEISRNIQEASQGTIEVSENIALVSETAMQTMTSAETLMQASSNMTRQTKYLEESSLKFLKTIRNI